MNVREKLYGYYRELVQVARRRRRVALIAALPLAVLWKDYRSGAFKEEDLETAAFSAFLCGRMIGAAAEM